ncbi:hypothetical protein OPV22_004163 [Ensete ventricosum]|uniref:Transcription elongation factor 1 homolog n=1 Tax=Ensete ventricosum TaxID=4639 RepID=A0AAV8S314_ENSVE|nr:hypothetical protein OPV22_004163 [Ensete ventricosum]RWW68882.1 hypothetical protein BHE74_00023558 [Ensete ventricosum]
MAKRRSRVMKLIKTTKVQPKLEAAFTCPFCNHDKSVSCTLDKTLKIGEAQCEVCKESYATTIHHLTEPIDIYAEWVDECEQVDKSEDLRVDDHRPTEPIDIYTDECEKVNKSGKLRDDYRPSKKRRAVFVDDYDI